MIGQDPKLSPQFDEARAQHMLLNCLHYCCGAGVIDLGQADYILQLIHESYGHGYMDGLTSPTRTGTPA